MALIRPSEAVLPGLVAYADRLHRGIGAKHHVVSPLGAWMVLAIAGLGGDESSREAVESSLGIPLETAVDHMRRLLEQPHAGVGAAMAMWDRTEADSPVLHAWRKALPNGVASGPMPSAQDADAWARDATLGKLDRFPAPELLTMPLLLLSTLVVSCRWQKPYETIQARRLAPRDLDDTEERLARYALPMEKRRWSERLQVALHAPMGQGGRIVRTADAGLVATHTRPTTDLLAVTSVIAEPGVPAAAVIRAAHEIAIAQALGRPTDDVSLFDLPLGEATCWSIHEREEPLAREREEVEVVLPAWFARATLDLLQLDPGLAAAATAVARRLGVPRADLAAAQFVEARYHRLGFEAKAVTAFMSRGMGDVSPRRPDTVRSATLRYTHPFAFVAVALDGPGSRVRGTDIISSPWRGVPVFSGWVATPAEATG